MAEFDQLLKSYDIGDLLDDIASADPPSYLRRCFAEGCSAPVLSFARVQQLAACALVLDAVVDDSDYPFFEHELIADWRIHFAGRCARLKDTASQALRRALELDRPADPEAAAELQRLAAKVAPA